jgi:hypothetical protein
MAGAEPTQEWRKIETIEEAEIIRRKARGTFGVVVPKKQNPSGGKRHVSVAETGTENHKRPVSETGTAVPPPETVTTSISPPHLASARQQARASSRRRSLPGRER